MTDVDHIALRTAAMAAVSALDRRSNKPWFEARDCVMRGIGRDRAVFIAIASPTTVLALLDKLEAAEQRGYERGRSDERARERKP